MMSFNKAYNLKTISLVVAVTFFVTTTAYGIDLSNGSLLRLPTNTEQTKTRLERSTNIMSSIIQVRRIFDRSKPMPVSGNHYYKRWINWWLNPLVASTLGPIILGLVWAFFLPDFSPFIAQWLSVGLTSWAVNAPQGRKALLSPATILLSVGTGAFGPLFGIPDLSGPAMTILAGLAIITTGFRVYVDLHNAKDIEKILSDNMLMPKKRRFNRTILTLTILSALLVLFARHTYNKYDYFSLPQKLDGLGLEFWRPPGVSVEVTPDYPKQFTWFKYMKALESGDNAAAYSLFRNTYQSPEEFANSLLYLEGLKAAGAHVIPVNAVDYIRVIRRMPPEYIKWIDEIAARHGRHPELFVVAMMGTAWHDYGIGHGVDVLYRRKFDSTHVTFEGLRRHWPEWWFEFSPGLKVTDFITGPVLGAKSSVGIYQIRPAMVRRYLKTLDGRDVASLTDREISIALLTPRTNIEAFAEIQEKVIAQVDSIREAALRGIAPDMTDFYRESYSETRRYGGLRPTAEDYSSIPPRAILGEQDWVLWIYHPLYYLKFWPSVKHMDLVVLSGIFDDKPAIFDVSEISPEQLTALEDDSDPYIKNAAKNTIRRILLGEDTDMKLKLIELLKEKGDFFFLGYLSLPDLGHVVVEPAMEKRYRVPEKTAGAASHIKKILLPDFVRTDL